MKKIYNSPKKFFPALTLVLGLSLVSSCAKDKGPFIVPPTNAAPISFGTDIQQVLTTNCATGGCHDGSAYDPNLSPGVAYANIVNVPSPNYAPFFIVRPNLADSSVLYHKVLNDDPGTYGGQMPPSTLLQSYEVDNIKKWINQGALNN